LFFEMKNRMKHLRVEYSRRPIRIILRDDSNSHITGTGILVNISHKKLIGTRSGLSGGSSGIRK
jgi:hypothetical protein